MSGYYCNPVNVPYRYQYIRQKKGTILSREAADPSLIRFNEKYYLFPSMSKGFFVSSDLVNWEERKLSGLPVYDYAPDVRVMGDYLYFSASRRNENCDFYRTKDPESGIFERIPGTFDFWDPNLFMDDDGRVYFYWGCSSVTPIYGAELDPDSMERICEPVALIDNHKDDNGYERVGWDHNEIKQADSDFLQMLINGLAPTVGKKPDDISDIRELIPLLPADQKKMIQRLTGPTPNIEGAWMTKHEGRYYLQYAASGTEYNVYPDGVYISDYPLGPFRLAENNPYSYNPGGFMTGAGHGSTMEDEGGNWWHAATMTISMNHSFERRIGIWPAGFDEEGELFCNQRFGDWPHRAESGALKVNPWADPDWMLLSYHADVTASSEVRPDDVQDPRSKGAASVCDENARTWWKAACDDHQPWIELDLQKIMKIHAVQINFMDDLKQVDFPEKEAAADHPDEITEKIRGTRYIEDRLPPIRWILEGSADHMTWSVIKDKSDVATSLPHDLLVWEEGIQLRYLRLTVLSQAHEESACISGIRVFGIGDGARPEAVSCTRAVRINGTDMEVSWNGNAIGYEILWGHSPDKLYHNYRVFAKNDQIIRALVASVTDYYVRIDAFNDNGITKGEIVHVSKE